MDLVKEFETCQCTVKVYDTGWCVDYYNIYCIKSFHHKNGKITTRFGTKTQVESMIRSYGVSSGKRFKL